MHRHCSASCTTQQWHIARVTSPFPFRVDWLEVRHGFGHWSPQSRMYILSLAFTSRPLLLCAHFAFDTIYLSM
jgi:hypothetical protein